MSTELFSGSWYSTKYAHFISHGKVWARIPQPLPDVPVEVDATLLYLGLYRLRREEKLKLSLCGKKATEENHVTPEIKDAQGTSLPHGVGRMTCTITQQGVNDKGKKYIKGEYFVDKPEDYGTFDMKEGDVGKCLLM